MLGDDVAGDQRQEPAEIAGADVIGDRHRAVADARREHLRQQRRDRAVGQRRQQPSSTAARRCRRRCRAAGTAWRSRSPLRSSAACSCRLARRRRRPCRPPARIAADRDARGACRRRTSYSARRARSGRPAACRIGRLLAGERIVVQSAPATTTGASRALAARPGLASAPIPQKIGNSSTSVAIAR